MPDVDPMDDQPTDPARRAEALERVRGILTGAGCTAAEIDRALADDAVDLLMVDRLLLPTERRMTQTEVAELTGMPIDDARRFWRALGFHDVGVDDPAFSDVDIEAVELFQSMVSMGLVESEWAVQMARVIGTSMARIAEAEVGTGATPIMRPSGDSVIDADRFARMAGASLPGMARLFEYVWRRHLQAATRRAMLKRSRGEGENISQNLAIGFADMVGYTMLSQHLSDEELAATVSRFDELAHETVVGLGGRVVKMIGDEVMFVVETASSAAEIGLSLAEAYADDELMSDVRVALAIGAVLVHDGDFYGHVVNLASRLVGVANPGTVLISDEFHSALDHEGGELYESKALRTRNLKDIGRVQVWKLTRVGSEPGADRQRNFRWDRLREVLRDVDDLRDRGEQLVARRSIAAQPGQEGEGEVD